MGGLPEVADRVDSAVGRRCEHGINPLIAEYQAKLLAEQEG